MPDDAAVPEDAWDNRGDVPDDSDLLDEADRRWNEGDARWEGVERRPPGGLKREGPRLSSKDELTAMREAGPYLGLGLQIAFSMVFFVGLGYAADRWLDTSPWGILVGAVLAMTGVLMLLIRLAREADARKRRGRQP